MLLPQTSGFNLPEIDKPNTDVKMGNPTYADVIGQIQKLGDQPSITGTVMPSIMQLLSPEGQKVSPYAKALEVKTGQDVSKVQSNMQKRGLTGSDIEATAMGQAYGSGQQALAQMYSDTSNQLAGMIYQAATGDLAQNRELIMTLAQAMGQELTSQRDMEMFQKALQVAAAEAEDMRRQAKSSAMGGMFGSLAGAGIGALGFATGNPMIGLAGMQFGAGQGRAMGSAASL